MPDVEVVKIAIIGGSGLGDALGGEIGDTKTFETPFGAPSSPVVLAKWHDIEIALLQRHGTGHIYNPSNIPYRANIHALKQLGITHIIASGATGSLRENISPGDLVIVDQVIDKTSKRANTFYEDAAVHVELAEPFCPVMRKWLLQAVEQSRDHLGNITVHDGGTYVCMEGPSFSTKAESQMHRQWGGDLIGMTCMPEAKLAREAEIAYALLALPTDYDCWKPHPGGIKAPDLLAEIIGNLRQASSNGIELIKAALTNLSTLYAEPSPAHNALSMAIWSDKSEIDPAEIQRLNVLWGRHFSD